MSKELLITTQETNNGKVHTNPVLCFIETEEVTVSNDLNSVTCQYCSYYFFHPIARVIELKFRNKKQQMIEEISEFTFTYTPFDNTFPIRHCIIKIRAKSRKDAELIALANNYLFFDQDCTVVVHERMGYVEKK